jgi:serine/threonine-protein kinase
MVTQTGITKLLDFGVARAATQTHSTAVGQLKGKVAYMAPECFRHEDIDRRVDVFSLGVVLHELVSGKRLFRQSHEAATMAGILFAEVPSLLEQGVPKELDEIAARALAKKADDRYATAVEMQQELEQLIMSRGLVATPFGIGRFVKDLMDRHGLGAKLGRALRGSSTVEEGSHSSGLSGPALTPSGSVSDFGRLEPLFDERGSTGRAAPATPAPAAPHRRGSWWAVFALAALAGALAAGVVVGRGLGNAPTATAVVRDAATGGGGAGAARPPGPGDAAGSHAGEGGDAAPVERRPPTPRTSAASDSGAGPTVDAGDAGRTDGPDPPGSRSPLAKAGKARPPGTLYLRTTPWTKVSLGGRSLGTTPLVGVSLPPGRHSLRLTDVAGTKHVRTVEIRAGEATKVHLELGAAPAN